MAADLFSRKSDKGLLLQASPNSTFRGEGLLKRQKGAWECGAYQGPVSATRRCSRHTLISRSSLCCRVLSSLSLFFICTQASSLCGLTQTDVPSPVSSPRTHLFPRASTAVSSAVPRPPRFSPVPAPLIGRDSWKVVHECLLKGYQSCPSN